MAPTWQAYPSGFTTEINSIPDTFIHPPESLGTPADAPATDPTAENSIFSMLKTCVAVLGNIPAGSGDATVNAAPKVFGDPRRTLGEMDDAAVIDATAIASVIALTKGVLTKAGV